MPDGIRNFMPSPRNSFQKCIYSWRHYTPAKSWSLEICEELRVGVRCFARGSNDKNTAAT